MDWKRWLKPAAKLAIVALLTWFLRGTLEDAKRQITEQRVQLDLGWLVTSGVLYLLGQLPSALFWHRVMVRMGQNVRRYPAIRAWYIGQLGKYVPGKALVIVLRAGFLRGHFSSLRTMCTTRNQPIFLASSITLIG